MKIAILLYEPSDRQSPYIIGLQHELVDAGHVVAVVRTTLTQMRMDLSAVKQLVDQTEADAWVVLAAGPEILKWFSDQPKPAFAIFGRRAGIPIAAIGPQMVPGMMDAVRHMISLGHRRIVKICRSERKSPNIGAPEQALLDEMAAHGIHTGDYNLPDWDETAGGFHRLMESLFKLTPPTALIVDEAQFLVALIHFLCSKGIRVPEDVSVMCLVSDPIFAWCTPSVAQLRWDPHRVIGRVVHWADGVSKGEKDIRQSYFEAEFFAGGTIGPPPPA